MDRSNFIWSTMMLLYHGAIEAKAENISVQQQTAHHRAIQLPNWLVCQCHSEFSWLTETFSADLAGCTEQQSHSREVSITSGAGIAAACHHWWPPHQFTEDEKKSSCFIWLGVFCCWGTERPHCAVIYNFIGIAIFKYLWLLTIFFLLTTKKVPFLLLYLLLVFTQHNILTPTSIYI